jgi:antitoxin component YwqK of YwqJK toxin-antitoxin module
MSYFTPISSIPIIGSPGSITDFTQGSSEIDILQGNNVTGSHAITVGGRYSNLATTVTSSGVSFTGSISPVGELFRIYVDTSYSTAVSSSYLTDIKITKYNPIDVLPFSEIHKTGSSTFTSWYDEQYVSASDYDRDNVHALTNTLPEFLQHDNQMDNTTLRKFTNLSGEHFDLIKNYIDNYILLFKRDHTDASSNNLLPVLAKQQGWDFNIPFGKKEDGNLSEFMGSTISNINNTTDVKNNIWRNVLNSINYIYRTKGTHNSIRALLNSYGFPPDILKLREHGASMDQSDNTALSDDISNNVDGLGGTSGNVSFTTKKDKVVAYIIDTPNRKINAEWRRDSVDADGVEYIFKPVRSTNTQTILESSGSGTETLWDVILEPSASDNVKSRLQFRLNTSETGSLDITTTSNRVSMSTDYHDFRNQRFWNVLLQRTEGPSGSGENLLTSHSYQLAVGEQVDDKIKTLQIVSMSFGGTTYSQSAANWIGTGSRPTGTGGNLVVGETYTGSLLEFRTWKYALSASKFKQHIYDKKSVVGNSVTDSQTNLIYHFRLNENWVSGSSNPKIKDSNTSNLKDYSIDISNDTLGHTNLYDLDEFDRIQFNVGIGGASELSDNNIIIDADRRFINNLNPTEPSVLNLQDPLINKRKASSVVEIVRSPQDVINDFILNQLGNFDFNDKFADPQDINEPLYKDLETFAKDFFDYYDISMDINKYIRAQATIFNQDLIKSVKRLVPARAAFSKIGVELKPTFLERPKFRNNKIEQSLIGIGPSNIKYHTVDPNDDTPISDWENNVFLGKKIEPSLHQTKDTTIEIYSITGSKYYDFTDQYELYKTKDVFIEISSPTGSILNLVEEYIPNKDIHIEVASHTGSVLNLVEEYVPNKDIHIEVASHTGSILNLVEEYIPNKDIHIEVASHTGSVLNLVEEYIPNKDISIEISSHTGSVLNLVEEYVPNKDISIEVASHTGSVLNLVEEYVPNKDISIEVASHTGSVLNLVEEYVPNKDISIEVASHTGSVLNLTEEISNPHNSNLDISVGNQTKTGSLLLKSEVKSIHNIDIGVASATSSNPTLSTNLFTTKNGTFNFIGNDTLVDKLNSSYSDPIDSWGTSSNDTHFIHLTTGSEGKYGDYNTYHYEKRYIFNMIGDVETLSGSYTSISSSFFTDFTGTVTNGIYTASKDITNKTIISNEIGLGDRSLGITVGFKSTGSISFKGGKFLDETFVYPANHQFVVGTSKDSIDSLIYTGTQNNGGETLEFEAFGDLSNDAFYYVQTTGGSGYTIQYDA